LTVGQVLERINLLSGPTLKFDEILDSLVNAKEHINSPNRIEEISVNSSYNKGISAVQSNPMLQKDTLIPSTPAVEEEMRIKPVFSPIKEKQMKSHKKERIDSIKTERSASKGSGLLIDCGRMAIKQAIETFDQAMKIIPSNVILEDIKGIKADGHSFTNLYNLPCNLLILNISNCHLISLVSVYTSCKKLKLLNASCNFIKSIEGIISLTNLLELYLNNNLLTNLNECKHLDFLNILDISTNPIGRIEDITELVKAKTLKYICFDNTPVINKEEYKAQPILESISEVKKYSKFIKIKDFVFGTVETPKEQSRIITEIISEEKPRCGESENVDESRMSKMSYKTDINDIMKSVASKNCTVVNTQNISNLRKGNDFNNPIAAMMIAPPQHTTKQPTLKKASTAQSLKVKQRIYPKNIEIFSKRQPNKKQELHVKEFQISPSTQKVETTRKQSFKRAITQSKPKTLQIPKHTTRLHSKNSANEDFKKRDEITPSSSKASTNQYYATPSNLYNNNETPVNLRDLLKKTCKVIEMKKKEKNVFDNSRASSSTKPKVVKAATKSGNDRQAILIDLRPERKLYLKNQCK